MDAYFTADKVRLKLDNFRRGDISIHRIAKATMRERTFRNRAGGDDFTITDIAIDTLDGESFTLSLFSTNAEAVKIETREPEDVNCMKEAAE